MFIGIRIEVLMKLKNLEDANNEVLAIGDVDNGEEDDSGMKKGGGGGGGGQVGEENDEDGDRDGNGDGGSDDDGDQNEAKRDINKFRSDQ